MCPEGMTTNGKYLLPFKAGAFQSLLPVDIWHQQAWGPIIDPMFDIAPWPHL